MWFAGDMIVYEENLQVDYSNKSLSELLDTKRINKYVYVFQLHKQ